MTCQIFSWIRAKADSTDGTPEWVNTVRLDIFDKLHLGPSRMSFVSRGRDFTPSCFYLHFFNQNVFIEFPIMAAKTTVQSGAALHPDLEKTVSRHSRSNIPDEALLASEADAELLGKFSASSDQNLALKMSHSKARIQARASSQFYLDRGLRYCL